MASFPEQIRTSRVTIDGAFACRAIELLFFIRLCIDSLPQIGIAVLANVATRRDVILPGSYTFVSGCVTAQAGLLIGQMWQARPMSLPRPRFATSPDFLGPHGCNDPCSHEPCSKREWQRQLSIVVYIYIGRRSMHPSSCRCAFFSLILAQPPSAFFYLHALYNGRRHAFRQRGRGGRCRRTS